MERAPFRSISLKCIGQIRRNWDQIIRFRWAQNIALLSDKPVSVRFWSILLKKVENRTAPKISRNFILSRLYRCNALYHCIAPRTHAQQRGCRGNAGPVGRSHHFLLTFFGGILPRLSTGYAGSSPSWPVSPWGESWARFAWRSIHLGHGAGSGPR
jgi:hypothetical protein